MELVWPYVVSVSNPSVNGFLNWAKNQKNELYKLKYEQHPIYQAIEIANEEQLLRLHPEIHQIIKQNSVIAQSGCKFGLNNLSELTRSIPVTFDEAQLQLSKSSLKKEEIIYMIETLIGSLNKARRPQFRQVRDLHNATDIAETEETI
ncbi:hypothetical protein C2G38_2197537 [Gigaspora rosea]|uniref:Uncharacterized protein n=1 Tax=Gigaspora rosea TaxID=44941 RepID=A0A397UTV8_9GLOM|nr:hypothetical protein C2G38_2197537 [Gigaspora rosea]